MSTPPSLRLNRARIALVQLGQTSSDKSFNLSHARRSILESVSSNAPGGKVDMVILPECFNSPYGVQYFADYAESFGGLWNRVKRPLPAALPRMSKGKELVRWTVDNEYGQDGQPSNAIQLDENTLRMSPSLKMLSEAAKEAGVVLVGGSVPERDDLTNNLYNTSCVFDEQGRIISMHRKVHLFDIDIPGKMTFQESLTLTGGDRVTVFDCSVGRFGLGICYDLRFPEPAQIASRLGAGCMIYPGAFNTTTGPLAWELLQRSRATDNQLYVVGCSPARPKEGYPAWGHSTVVDPLAKVISNCQEEECTIFAELDPEYVREVRKNIPIGTQRRFDVYPDVTCG
ncbi:carbon-nitrogen hydrolase [Violaceomyces palustris]|uniref:Carbon-nitrogen hydrolase n=1 Tax=Violaceomyces palustris TaxID=1673888 RepID=A0ACD0P2C9_9BASI|nr:carbon-nitrogen hydrolase [Violaceomyces palustris]